MARRVDRRSTSLWHWPGLQ